MALKTPVNAVDWESYSLAGSELSVAGYFMTVLTFFFSSSSDAATEHTVQNRLEYRVEAPFVVSKYLWRRDSYHLFLTSSLDHGILETRKRKVVRIMVGTFEALH